MLLIEQIYETNGLKSDYVKCPVCKQGRLCDKPMGDKVMVIAVSEGTGHQTGKKRLIRSTRERAVGGRFPIPSIIRNWARSL